LWFWFFEYDFSSVSRHCTRSYWLKKPFKEEGEQQVTWRTSIGMVIKKLCMQFGHLFTCVARMMQVVSENWFQISFPGYGRARHQHVLHALLVFCPLFHMLFLTFFICIYSSKGKARPLELFYTWDWTWMLSLGGTSHYVTFYLGSSISILWWTLGLSNTFFTTGKNSRRIY
jgi:hypothetical protein